MRPEKKSEIRTEVIQKFRDLLNLYVHGDESALHDLLDDLLHSKKWSSTFGILRNSKGDLTVHDKVLHSIVKEYKDCKNKEVNNEIKKQPKKMTQAINISGTFSRAKLHLKVEPLTALVQEQMQPVTWEGSTTILQKEEGFCLLLPVTIHSLS